MFKNHPAIPASAARTLAVLIPLSLALWAVPQGARAQGTSNEFASVEQREAVLRQEGAACKQGPDTSALGRQLLGFFNTGGYFLTGNGKRSALFGSPKFYNDATFYGHARHIGGLELSGGAETLTLSDHFVPFTGGNEFDLLGASASLSTPRGAGKLRAYVNAGLFYGRLRSVNQGFDRSQFTPSGSVGVEYPFTGHFSLEAAYRVSQQIRGINTDGFSFSLKIH